MIYLQIRVLFRNDGLEIEFGLFGSGGGLYTESFPRLMKLARKACVAVVDAAYRLRFSPTGLPLD